MWDDNCNWKVFPIGGEISEAPFEAKIENVNVTKGRPCCVYIRCNFQKLSQYKWKVVEGCGDWDEEHAFFIVFFL
jgi:hypothetical protein